jgi:hypothetical protein
MSVQHGRFQAHNPEATAKGDLPWRFRLPQPTVPHCNHGDITVGGSFVSPNSEETTSHLSDLVEFTHSPASFSLANPTCVCVCVCVITKGMPILNSFMCVESPCVMTGSFTVLNQTVHIEIPIHDAFASTDDQYQSLSLTVTFQDSAMGHCSATTFKFQKSESSWNIT